MLFIFVSFHFITLQSIQSFCSDSLSLAPFLAPAHTLSRPDSIISDNLFTLYHFNLIRAIILSHLRIFIRLFGEYVLTIQKGSAHTYTIEMRKGKEHNTHPHTYSHTTIRWLLAVCVRHVCATCVCVHYYDVNRVKHTGSTPLFC